MFDFLAFVQGFALGLGMFVCPGPKDLVILRQALHRRPTAELLLVGVGSDALLIALGIVGVSAALQQAPQAQRLALAVGVGLMLWHGVQAIWRASPAAATDPHPDNGLNARAVLLVASFLNPVTWMDTVLVIGTAGAVLPQRLQASYGVGAVVASLAWFSALTLGARSAAPWMARARARRCLDVLVALAMFGMAVWVGGDLL